MKNTNLKLSLRFMGEDFDIQEFTDALNIYPSETWKKGDFIRKSNKRHDYTAWIYNTDIIESLDMNVLVKRVEKLFFPKVDKIVELKERFKLDISIDFIVIIENGDSPAVYMQQEFIEFAAKIGARFDIDIYIN